MPILFNDIQILCQWVLSEYCKAVSGCVTHRRITALNDKESIL